jgi:hypothetical protein
MSSKGVQKCKKCEQEFEMLDGESDYCSFQCDPDHQDKWQPITREQVNEWCKAQSMVVVPREPTHKMLIILFDQWESEGRMTMTDNYKAMIRIAQENTQALDERGLLPLV